MINTEIANIINYLYIIIFIIGNFYLSANNTNIELFKGTWIFTAKDIKINDTHICANLMTYNQELIKLKLITNINQSNGAINNSPNILLNYTDINYYRYIFNYDCFDYSKIVIKPNFILSNKNGYFFYLYNTNNNINYEIFTKHFFTNLNTNYSFLYNRIIITYYDYNNSFRDIYYDIQSNKDYLIFDVDMFIKLSYKDYIDRIYTFTHFKANYFSACFNLNDYIMFNKTFENHMFNKTQFYFTKCK